MNVKKEHIILIGGGGHCSSVIDVIEQEGKYDIAGILDLKDNLGKTNLGYSIFGTDEDLPNLIKEYKNFFITIGQLHTPQKRIEIYNLLQTLNVNLPTIISPFSYISKYARIGKGAIIMHMAQVNANASIGNNCIINSKVLVEHDAIIGDHCHISTGSIINGGVHIGGSSFIGSGVVTKQYITIPEHSYIKANSLVK